MQVIYRQYLFKTQLPLMNRALDTYAMRQKTISKNIANATTPHYRPEKVRFEEYFQEAAVAETGARTDEMHIPLGKEAESDIEPELAQTDVPKAEVYFSGESHVDIDKEMSNLAQNQIRFRFAARAVKGYFSDMQSAIKYGG